MNKLSYRNRIVDKLLSEKLKSNGAILIRGPKWCGKTTTAEQQANSVLYLNDPSRINQNLELARIDPQQLLIGSVPRLLDEWQIAPELWDAVRYEVDMRREVGQFILTGSAVPLDSKNRNKIRHTGTGRFAFIDMLPMSLYESGESTGDVSIAELFDKPQKIRGINKLSLVDVSKILCRGGWPFCINSKLDENASLRIAYEYVDLVIEEDISRVEGLGRNPALVRAIMKSYARLQGTQTPVSTIRKDLINNDVERLADETVSKYLNALRLIFVVNDLEAWNPNLRSKTAIRTTPTRYFCDPSIAIASLRLCPRDLVNSLSDFGLFFETLCIRDLRVYTQAIDGDLYHYRDSNGLECDAVIHLRNGKYGLIEIKIGGDKLIEEGAKNLKKLYNILQTDKMGEPSFMMILTAVGDFAYRREDGIYIVPIGTLKN